MMEQSLRGIQVQKMMPQTLHSLQLLTLPLLLLKGYLGSLVLDNPFLEPCFDAMELPLSSCTSPEGAISEGEDMPPGTPRPQSGQGLLPFQEQFFLHEESSLYEHLRFQLELCPLEQADAAVARYLIANISHAGYLEESVPSAAAALGCACARVERVLRVVQSLSPRGVGARNLSECLCLQLDPQMADYPLLLRLLQEDLAALADRQFASLARKYKVSRPRIQALLDYVQTLDPKPGSRFSTVRFTPYIVPDAIINLSGVQPEIRVGGEASTLLAFDPDYMKETDDAAACEFLKQKRLEATALISSLNMRYRALERLVGYLAVEQRAFFIDGPAALRPLTQKKAAEDLGVHPSTISRCIRDKYIGTPRGSFPMSHFFSGGLGEGDCTTSLARDMVAALIAREDKTAPLNDMDIARRLAEQGIPISRRTVAKYRAQLGLGGQGQRIRYE